jgi:hypothetical protein
VIAVASRLAYRASIMKHLPRKRAARGSSTCTPRREIHRHHRGSPALLGRRLRRRGFLGVLAAAGALAAIGCNQPADADGPMGVSIPEIRAGEDIFAYIERVRGGFDRPVPQVIGAANEYKEGDEALGVAAADEMSRGTRGPCSATPRSASSGAAH